MYLKEQLDNCLQEIINLSAENEKLKREIARYKAKEDVIAETLGDWACTVTHDFKCSKCGKKIGGVRTCEMYETCDGLQAWKSLDHEVYDIPNYCPNCGAKVIHNA